MPPYDPDDIEAADALYELGFSPPEIDEEIRFCKEHGLPYDYEEDDPIIKELGARRRDRAGIDDESSDLDDIPFL